MSGSKADKAPNEYYEEERQSKAGSTKTHPIEIQREKESAHFNRMISEKSAI